MEKIKNILQNNYQLNNYQVAQLSFLFKTVISEISKICIIGVLFYDQLMRYIVALLIMCFLRGLMGGVAFLYIHEVFGVFCFLSLDGYRYSPPYFNSQIHTNDCTVVLCIGL